MADLRTGYLVYSVTSVATLVGIPSVDLCPASSEPAAGLIQGAVALAQC